MASFNEILQDLVNKDYDTLVKFAQQATVDVLPACKAVDKDHDGFLMISSIILSAIGADGTLTATEKRFLGDVTGLDEDTVTKYIGMYSKDMEDLVDHFADNLGDKVKAATIMLVASVCACDEKISREETAYLRKLLA